MRKNVRIILIIAGVFVLGIGGWYFSQPHEPSFKGKSLSNWVLLERDLPAGTQKEKAHAVVRQLAAKSIPLLMHWLRQPESRSLDFRVYELKSNIILWLLRHHIMIWHGATLTGQGGPSRRTIAGWAVADLDSGGRKIVIPQLIQMLAERKPNPNDDISEFAGTAYLVLITLAPESIDPLIAALSSNDIQVSTLAMAVLSNIGPEAKAAIPILKERLMDKDADIRIGTVEVIRKLGGDPNELVPVIIQSLPELRNENIGYALEVLLHFGNRAKAAVPVLVRLLNNMPESTNPTNIEARNEIITTLQELNPDAAAKVVSHQ